MSGANELILHEGDRWESIIQKIRTQFDPLPPSFNQDAENLRAHMIHLSFFRMNRGEDKGLCFVGSFHYTLCEQDFRFFVLPKYLKNTDADSASMPLVLSAISKTGHLHDFMDEVEFSESQRNSSEKKIDPHRLATWLVQDYNSNGIFFVREKRNSTQKKGRINWPKTISKKMPYLDGDDVFYEDPVYTSIIRNNQTLLSEIHRCAVKEALDYLGDSGRNFYTIPPECDATMLGKPEQYVSLVHKFQRVVFSNRDISLLRALEAWCHHQSRYYKLPVGTVSFDKVWEDALRTVFGNISKNFTFGAPEYHLGLKEGNPEKFQVDNDGIPDIIRIFKENNTPCFLLLDAKYYLGQIGSPSSKHKTRLKKGYQWIEQFPGYKDIAKQVDYRRTLESKYNLRNGVNAFVLPWYNIEELSVAPSAETTPPWVRYLGYATKGELNKEDDEISKLLNQLGAKAQTQTTDSTQRVLIIQIKPEWLFQELMHSSQNPQFSQDLWSLLKPHETN